MAEPSLSVEVAYAKPDQQLLFTVTLPAGATVLQAISASGLLQLHPELELKDNSVGVFGIPCTLEQPVAAADRVEIYRPLVHDPKEARRYRAKQR